MHKTKILIITPYLPYPLDAGGRVRQYNLLRRLASRHEITLVSFIDTPDELKNVRKVSEFCHRVETVLRKQPLCPLRSKTTDRLLRLVQVISSPFSPAPSELIKSFYSDEMNFKIAEVLGEEDFDLVQVDFTQMAKYLPEPTIPSILVEIDVMFRKYYRGFQVSTRPLTKTQALIDYFKVKKFELEACQKYDKIVTMSRDDKTVLLKYVPSLEVSVIPNGVDITYFDTSNSIRQSNKIVFIGGMTHTPNLDATNYFYAQIFPLIKKKVPSARLWVIGRHGREALPQLMNDDSIIVTDFVDDIRPHLADCSTFVVPLRIAGGTRLKILEAMAAGCAVVSTSMGAEGLEVTNKKDILISDIPQEFAQRVVEVITNPQLQKHLGDNARMLVKTKYDWGAIAKLQGNLYSELLEKSKCRKVSSNSAGYEDDLPRQGIL